MNNVKRSLLVCTAFLLSFNSVKSQDKDSITKKQLGEAIIAVFKVSNKLPFVANNISQEQIKLQNTGVDLPILLNTQTSVVTNSDAGNGVGYTGLRLRGSDITRINVTMNGVPVNDAEGQGVFFVNLPDLASGTQSIQVQRGVGSSSNGPASFGGTININNLNLKNKKEQSFQNDYSSFNTWKNSFTYNSGLLKNKFNIFGRLSRISSDGYIERSSAKLYSAQATASYHISKKASLVFNFLHGQEKTGQAWNGVPQDSLTTNRRMNELGLMNNGLYYKNQTDNYQQQYFQAFLNKEIATNQAFNLGIYFTKGLGYYEEYRINNSYAAYGLPNYYDSATNTSYDASDMVRQLWLNNNLLGAIANYTVRFKKSSLALGLFANNYNGKHYGKIIQAKGLLQPYTWYSLTANKNEQSGFAKFEYTIVKNVLLYADAQIRNVNYTPNGFRSNPNLNLDLNYLFFNPKAGFSYTLYNKNSRWAKLYSSFAVAHKEPNRDDLEAGKNNLPKAEKLQDLELGIDYKTSVWTTTVNFYRMNYKNQLVNNGKINDVGAYTRVNVDKSYRQGLELEVSYKPFKNLTINANSTFSKNIIAAFKNFIDVYDSNYNWLGQDSTVYNNTAISFSPSSIWGATLTYEAFKNKTNYFIQPTFIILSKSVSKQYLDNTQDESKMIKPYTTVDILSQLNIKSNGSSKLQLRFGIYNLFNTLYESNGYTFGYITNNTTYNYNYYFPQSGVRYTLGAGIIF